MHTQAASSSGGIANIITGTHGGHGSTITGDHHFSGQHCNMSMATATGAAQQQQRQQLPSCL
jgi:hypothetical protein